ncbi:hypothetical protein BH24ACT4_BH24ACT4_01390 [soil metagenome]
MRPRPPNAEAGAPPWGASAPAASAGATFLWPDRGLSGSAGASGGSPSRPGRGAVGQTDVPPRSEVSASGGPTTTLPTVGLGVGPDPPGDRSASRHRGVFPVEHPHRQTHQAHTCDRLLELAAPKDWALSLEVHPSVGVHRGVGRPARPPQQSPGSAAPPRPGQVTAPSGPPASVGSPAARPSANAAGGDGPARTPLRTTGSPPDRNSARRGPLEEGHRGGDPTEGDRHPPGGRRTGPHRTSRARVHPTLGTAAPARHRRGRRPGQEHPSPSHRATRARGRTSPRLRPVSPTRRRPAAHGRDTRWARLLFHVEHGDPSPGHGTWAHWLSPGLTHRGPGRRCRPRGGLRGGPGGRGPARRYLVPGQVGRLHLGSGSPSQGPATRAQPRSGGGTTPPGRWRSTSEQAGSIVDARSRRVRTGDGERATQPAGGRGEGRRVPGAAG